MADFSQVESPAAMDSEKLIVLVKEYEELYNLRHPDYSNQQRRDNVWEEIGWRMKQPSATCKSQWTRIRDNYRQILNLRKTKTGQTASKMKQPEFYKELQFLTPHLNEEDDQRTNLTPPISYDIGNVKKEKEEESYTENTPTTFPIPASSPTGSDTQYSTISSNLLYGCRKRTATDDMSEETAASVCNKSKEINSSTINLSTDPLINFFINMAQTVKTFPLQDQIHVKGQLFQMVNSLEKQLAQEMDRPNSNISSGSQNSAQHQQDSILQHDTNTASNDAVMNNFVKFSH